MTNFSTNQVMQFYVVEGTPAVAPCLNGGVKIQFKDAEGNVTAVSDKIENVMYGKLTEAEALAKPYKKAVLTFDSEVNGGAPIVGENYIVRVSYPEIGGVGNEAWTTKTAAYHVSKDVSAVAVYESIVKDLNTAFATDGVLKAEVADGVVITQTDVFKNAYKRGLRPVTVIDFTVATSMVALNGEFTSWESVDYSYTGGIGSGYKVADMEYFAMGERGDQYRNVDYINAIDTEYKVDPKGEYDVLTIHYAYTGSNQNSHKSEKDIVIVETKNGGKLATLAGSLKTALGATFTKVTKAEAGTKAETAL